MSKLSENLKTLLWEFRISESELARRIGVSQPVIHRIAKGLTKNPNIDTLRPIVKYFSISMDQLIGDSDLPIESLRQGSLTRHKHWQALPLLTWQQAIFWDQLSANFNPLQRINTEAEVSDNAFVLRVDDKHYEPIFVRGTYLTIDPNVSPKHEDYVLAYVKAQEEINIYRCLEGEKQHRLQNIDPENNRAPVWGACKILGVIVEAKVDLHHPQTES